MADQRRVGFTLIELMVATGLFTIVAGGIYGTYAAGLRTWSRAQETLTVTPRLALCLEHLAAQARSSVAFPQRPWASGEGSLAFVTVRADRWPVAVAYVRTPEGHLVERQETLTGELLREHHWVTGVTAFTLAYGYLEEDGTLVWQPLWGDPEHLPQLVRLTVTTTGASRRVTTLTKTIGIPTGELGTIR